MANDSLVIELDVDLREEDDVNQVGFKLYRIKKSWFDAETHCTTEGGYLVSIHSEEEQGAALDVADGNEVWIGGSSFDGQWDWADNSSWDFTKWKKGGGGDDAKCLSIKPRGEWHDSTFSSHNCEIFSLPWKHCGNRKERFDKD